MYHHHIFLLLLIVVVVAFPLVAVAPPPFPTSHITVTGSVFCDVCYNNSFTKHSYFLPGADVHVRCKFQANAPKTTEQISFSVNRTTNRYGVYRLDIPSVEGVDCVEGPGLQSSCEASLIGSSVSACNVPAISSTSKEITVKSRSTNLCVYGVSALSYRPFKRNSTLCGTYDDINIDEEQNMLSDSSFNSSKFFLPYFPWPLPPFPPLPPWPSLPPWPALPPLPPFPSFPPFQFPPMPSSPPFPPFQFPPMPTSPPFPPFQFPPMPPSPPLPHLPPLPPLPKLPPLPPLPNIPPLPPSQSAPPSNFPPFTRVPGFNPGDPRSWVPNNPSSGPPSPPFNPRTQIPGYYFLGPPTPGFDPRDPRTWIPTFPPSPSPQTQQP